jgi:nucleotide-binding universal stress UspA family protein
MTRPNVLCPVDFRDASRGALRYAAAIAEHFYATLTVLTVNDPVINDVAVFVDEVFAGQRPTVPELRLETTSGLPAVEILRTAHDSHAEVIVMSTRGAHAPLTLLGSVTAHVLREADVPVLVTPPEDPGPRSLEQWRRSRRTVLVPVDFSPWTASQAAVACGLAEAIGGTLLFLHVTSDPASRLAAHHALDRLIHEAPCAARPTMCLAIGDPATEIARIARERAVDVIVMGLHSGDEVRGGVGHVTYAVLCQTPTLVLAWPPRRGQGAELRTKNIELRTQLATHD